MPNIPLLTEIEEKELIVRMNSLFDTLKEKILLSNKEAQKIISSKREEHQRDIEEVLIDNFFNSKLNSLNYYKILQLKPIDNKATDYYKNDTSIEERKKQLLFIKRTINKKLEMIKEMRNNIENSNNKLNNIKEIDLSIKEIDDIKNLEELLNYQIEYLMIINKFFEANTRLAFKIAMRYRAYYWANQIDLIQAANLGLLKAIKKFNPHLGYKFSTYATWWIRQNTKRYLCNNDSIIRKPVYAIEQINRIKRVQKRLEENGEEPTIEKIAEETKLLVEKVQELLKIEHVCDTVSLQKKLKDSDEELGNFIIDKNSEPQDEVENDVFESELKEQISSEISNLNEREQYVIIKRFGLDGSGMHTLDYIGKDLNVTRERIRQIEKKALKKLRNSSNSKKMKDFL